jgi:hypothetical protein
VSTEPKDVTRASRMIAQTADEDDDGTGSAAGEPHPGPLTKGPAPSAVTPSPAPGDPPPTSIRPPLSSKDAFVTKPVAYAPPQLPGGPTSRPAPVVTSAPPPPRPPSVPPETRRRLRWALVVPAIAIVGAVTALVAGLTTTPAPAEKPATAATPEATAIGLRHEANEACTKHAWDQCLKLLNAARELDPAGEKTPEVKALRSLAEMRQ